MAQFKDVLRELRSERDAKQSTMAKELNLAQGTYSSYENGITPPTETCIRIAKYFGISLEYLLGLSDERHPVGGKLDSAFAQLALLSGRKSPMASDILPLLEAASAYYQQGAPCGDVPLYALRGFLSGLCGALNAAARRDAPATLESVNSATIAALEIAKMPMALYENKDI